MKTFMGVKGWHVSGYSKNKEWAQKFVEFITMMNMRNYRFEQTQEVPTNEGLINDPAIAENAGAKAVAEQSNTLFRCRISLKWVKSGIRWPNHSNGRDR